MKGKLITKNNIWLQKNNMWLSIKCIDKFISPKKKTLFFNHFSISLVLKLSLLIKRSNIVGNLIGNLIFAPGLSLKVQYLHS